MSTEMHPPGQIQAGWWGTGDSCTFTQGVIQLQVAASVLLGVAQAISVKEKKLLPFRCSHM